MKKDTYEFQTKSNLDKSSVYDLRSRPSQNLEKVDIKSKILPLCVLSFVGIWISLCLANGNYLLNEALICSAIILGLMFFKAADQNNDLEDFKDN